MNRELYQRDFSSGSIPPWGCPRCKRGTLHLTEDGLVTHEEYSSRVNRREYGPTDETGRFACVMICNQSACKEAVSVSGTYSMGQDEDSDGQMYTWERYEPRFFDPPIPMIDVPKRCPKNIDEQIKTASLVYWCDPDSCINHIRTAVELFLTDLDIPRTRIVRNASGKSRRHRLTLHDRIEILRGRRAELADPLQALRWLGNAGSHPEGIARSDALDGFEILERILERHYERRDENFAKMTKAIISRKGPRKQGKAPI